MPMIAKPDVYYLELAAIALAPHWQCKCGQFNQDWRVMCQLCLTPRTTVDKLGRKQVQ